MRSARSGSLRKRSTNSLFGMSRIVVASVARAQLDSAFSSKRGFGERLDRAKHMDDLFFHRGVDAMDVDRLL